MTWRASFPRKSPAKLGCDSLVVAVKTPMGGRFELSGDFNHAEVLLIWHIANAAAGKNLPAKLDEYVQMYKESLNVRPATAAPAHPTGSTWPNPPAEGAPSVSGAGG